MNNPFFLRFPCKFQVFLFVKRPRTRQAAGCEFQALDSSRNNFGDVCWRFHGEPCAHAKQNVVDGEGLENARLSGNRRGYPLYKVDGQADCTLAVVYTLFNSTVLTLPYRGCFSHSIVSWRAPHPRSATSAACAEPRWKTKAKRPEDSR